MTFSFGFLSVTDQRANSRARAITKTGRLVEPDCDENNWDNDTSVLRPGENHGESYTAMMPLTEGSLSIPTFRGCEKAGQVAIWNFRIATHKENKKRKNLLKIRMEG
jgi:hypothetical protein